jgi:small GTP-binding protein
VKKILRQVYIYKGEDLLYYMHFGKALKQDLFSKLVKELMQDIYAKKSIQSVESHDYYKYKISYTASQEHDLLFLFVTGLTDSNESIKKELIRCKKEFLNLFSDILQHKFDAKTFEVFDPTIDSIHRNLRPKISLVGFSGVGKTTITKLIKAEEIPMKHVPTITGDIATIKIGKLYFHLWDFAGQEQFSYLWNNFVKGSDAVLLITDSSLENVEKSKFFLELIKEEAPQAHTAVIGNKQDLSEALKPIQIEKILGLKTYSMIAKENKNRDKMIQIIADVLEMSAEVSPLLKPLLERDRLTEEAMNALENAEFSEAALLFEKISDLCIELGDDSLGREFYEKSEKIREMLQKVGAPQQPPVISPPQKPSPEPVKEQPAVPSQKPPPVPVKEQPMVPSQKPPPVPVKEQPAVPPQRPTPEPIKKAPASIFEELSDLEKVEKPELIQEPVIRPSVKEIEEFEKIKEQPTEPEKKEKKKKKKKKKKEKKKKKKKQIEELKVHKVTSIIQEPSFLKKEEASKVAQITEDVDYAESIKEDEGSVKPETSIDSDMPWLHPKLKRMGEERKIDSLIEKALKAEEDDQILFKPKIEQNKGKLEINPEDFMIKQRPKKVLSVPEDAKDKLKTSAFGHVSNVPSDIPKSPVSPTKLIKPQEEIPKPVAPTKLIKPVEKTPKPDQPTKIIEPEPIKPLEKPKIPPAPVIPKKPVDLETSEVTEPVIETQKAKKPVTNEQRKNLEDTLIDLKIKKAKLQKMALDFDMQELSGEITSEQLKEKKEKLKELEKKIEEQIAQTEGYLQDLN